MTIKLVPALAGQHFSLLQQVCLDFDARPRIGVTLKDVLNPAYWVAVANQLKPGCEIRVIPEDNTWYAKLLVLGVQRLNDVETQPTVGAYVTVVHYADLKPKAKVIVDEYEIRSTNGGTKYGVFRKSDNQIMKGNIHTEKQAQDFLDDLVRSQAA